MAEGDIPRGQRFSHVYLQRPNQLEDSERMRRRLGANAFDCSRLSWHAKLFGELGIPPVRLATQRDLMNLFVSLNLVDVMDSITILQKCAEIDVKTTFVHRDKTNAILKAATLLQTNRRIFEEERVRYKIDDAGGVHLAVDRQFEVAKATTVQGMGDPRYAEALRLLEDGYRALDGVPPDGKEAVRGVFGAAENLFRLTFGTPKINRLTGPFIDQNLKPAVAELPWDQEGRDAGAAMVEALKDWATASHKYRHEAGHPDPHQPPLDLAILMVTQGTGFVRWLVTIDRAVKAAAAASPAP